MDDILIINLPIEPMEERYSTQWWKWFEREFTNAHIPYYTLPQTYPFQKIEVGRFLDVLGTMKFKSYQQNLVINKIEMLRTVYPNRKIIFFFHDLWNPAVLNIAYILDCMNLREQFKICGCLHAGSYDPHDFLHKKDSGWMSYFEGSLERAVNEIFFATEFSRNLFLKGCFKREFLVDDSKLVVTGFPIYDEFVEDIHKEEIIVFPHRLDEEKQPWLFDELEQRLKKDLPDWKFIKTKDVCKTKQEYYNLLNRSMISVSFALQETWGIATQESLFCSCVPFVPNRLSYPEMYHSAFIYEDMDDLQKNILYLIEEDFLCKEYIEAMITTHGKLEYDGKQAITNMVREMKKL